MALPPPIPVSQLQVVTSAEPTDLQYLVRPSLGAEGSLAIATKDLIDSVPPPPITLPLVYPPGVTQTFSPNATNSGLNVGQVASDPTDEVNGNIWYNTATNQLMATINGVAVPLAIGPLSTRILTVNGNFTLVSGADLQVMHSFTLPAGTLAKNGDSLKVQYGGGAQISTSQKRLVVDISGVTLYDSGLVDLGGNGNDWRGFCIHAMYLRMSPTYLLCSFQLIINTTEIDFQNAIISPLNEGGIITAYSNPLNVPNMDTNDLVLSVQGASADGGASFYQIFSFIELKMAPVAPAILDQPIPAHI